MLSFRVRLGPELKCVASHLVDLFGGYLIGGILFRSPFVSPFEKRLEADLAKRALALGCSDHLTLLNAYAGW